VEAGASRQYLLDEPGWQIESYEGARASARINMI
jgi:hypothetical protein